MLSKVQEMKAQEKEKEEKRKKNAQKKEDIKIAFMCCKDKCVCEGKRKCAAAGLNICEVCSNVLQSTCGKAACKIDGKRPMMILPAAANLPLLDLKESYGMVKVNLKVLILISLSNQNFWMSMM